jgi:hypothetical protein
VKNIYNHTRLWKSQILKGRRGAGKVVYKDNINHEKANIFTTKLWKSQMLCSVCTEIQTLQVLSRLHVPLVDAWIIGVMKCAV